MNKVLKGRISFIGYAGGYWQWDVMKSTSGVPPHETKGNYEKGPVP